MKKRTNHVVDDVDDFVTPLAKKSKLNAFKAGTRSSARLFSKFILPLMLIAC